MLSKYIRTQILPLFEHEHYFNTKPQESFLAVIDETRHRFPFAHHLDYVAYEPKKMIRYKVSKEHFADAFDGYIADIGDRNGSVRAFATGTVETVDKNNTAAKPFDWDADHLPFHDKQFDAVFCLDTLEHIADIHEAFADLLRVSKRYAVISLPNNWKKTLPEIVRGRSIRTSYGLPVEKPMDRHRWYMNTEEIEDFLFYNAAKNGYRVADVVYHVARRVWWHSVVIAFRPLVPERYFKNFFIANVFVKLERTN